MRDPFQKRPLPAFFAALCFVVSFMLLATLLEEITETAPTAHNSDSGQQSDAVLVESAFTTPSIRES
ncbi:MAG: hypothetical protein CMJ96_00245 [Planctomycetes bacterium]|nr:hypothetical protein [Planctomycetota bacterium]